MRRVVWLLAILVVAGLFVAGCGGGGGGGGDDLEPDSTVFGVWMPVYMEVDGVVTPVYNGMDFPDDATHTTLEFKADTSLSQVFLDEDDQVVDTAEGTYWAQDQSGWINFDEQVDFDYFSWGNVLEVNYDDGDGHPVYMRMVRITTLTERDSNVVKAWYVDAAWVNGTAVPVNTLFQADTDTDLVLLQPTVEGSAYYRELDDHTILTKGQGTWWCEDMELVVQGAFDVDTLPGTLRAICDAGGQELTFLTRSGDTVQLLLYRYSWDETRDSDLYGYWYAGSCTKDGNPADLADYFGWPGGTTGQGLAFWPDGSVESSRYDPTWASGEFGGWTSAFDQITLYFNDTVIVDYTADGSSIVTTDTTSDPGHTWVVNWLVD